MTPVVTAKHIILKLTPRLNSPSLSGLTDFDTALMPSLANKKIVLTCQTNRQKQIYLGPN